MEMCRQLQRDSISCLRDVSSYCHHLESRKHLEQELATLLKLEYTLNYLPAEVIQVMRKEFDDWAGKNGKDGERGPKGNDGKDGKDGERGPTGKAGARGPKGDTTFIGSRIESRTIQEKKINMKNDEVMKLKCNDDETLVSCNCHNAWSSCDGTTVSGNICEVHAGENPNTFTGTAVCVKLVEESRS